MQCVGWAKTGYRWASTSGRDAQYVPEERLLPVGPDHHGGPMGLDGPAREIIVEPITTPAPDREREPAPPGSEPVKKPGKEPVPA
jgi:hypothetical protein